MLLLYGIHACSFKGLNELDTFCIQAICAIRDGLNDPLVRTGHKLSLHQRASRMKESASLKKYRLLLRDLPTVHVQDVTHVSLPFFLIFDYNIV